MSEQLAVMRMSTYRGLCDKVREKTNTTDTIPAETMVSLLDEIGGGGGGLDEFIEEHPTEVNLPTATKIKTYAFYYNTDLTNVNMPNVTDIGSYAFYRCKGLKAFELPEGLNYIGSSAFIECSNLVITKIPSTVTRLSAQAFRSCTSITEITFKGTPLTIGTNAFIGCSNLTTINVPWAEGEVADAPWNATNATINYNYVEEGA
jgi:hypothetical protein